MSCHCSADAGGGFWGGTRALPGTSCPQHTQQSVPVPLPVPAPCQRRFVAMSRHGSVRDPARSKSCLCKPPLTVDSHPDLKTLTAGNGQTNAIELQNSFYWKCHFPSARPAHCCDTDTAGKVSDRQPGVTRNHCSQEPELTGQGRPDPISSVFAVAEVCGP